MKIKIGLLVVIIFASFYFFIHKTHVLTADKLVDIETNHDVENRSNLQFHYNSSTVETNMYSEQLVEDILRSSSIWMQEIETPNYPQVYLLSKKDSAYNLYFSDKRINGLYVPETNKIYINMESEADLDLTLIHEYGHFILNAYVTKYKLSHEHLPFWFHEGFANLFEWEVTKNLPATVTNFQATKFQYLNDISAELYSQGFFAIVDLKETIGDNFLQKIMEKMIVGNSFEEAVSMFAVDLNVYHERFSTQLEVMEQFDSLLNNNPQQLIAIANSLDKGFAYPNPYSVITSFYRMKAYLSLEDMDNAYKFAQQAAQLRSNPLELIQISKAIGPINQTFADELLNKARDMGIKQGYDVDILEQYIQNN